MMGKSVMLIPIAAVPIVSPVLIIYCKSMSRKGFVTPPKPVQSVRCRTLVPIFSGVCADQLLMSQCESVVTVKTAGVRWVLACLNKAQIVLPMHCPAPPVWFVRMVSVALGLAALVKAVDLTVLRGPAPILMMPQIHPTALPINAVLMGSVGMVREVHALLPMLRMSPPRHIAPPVIRTTIAPTVGAVLIHPALVAGLAGHATTVEHVRMSPPVRIWIQTETRIVKGIGHVRSWAVV
jgi:hypothetical protein